MQTIDFVSKRVTRSAVIHLNAPLERVFPLFGALRERDWAAGWDPAMVFSESGDMEEHMVFRTTSAHGHAEADYTWLVSQYRPEEHFVEYTVFTSGRVWWITIQCRAGERNAITDARVTYTYNGLSEAGNHLNQLASERMFARDLHDWEEEINGYMEKAGKPQAIA